MATKKSILFQIEKKPYCFNEGEEDYCKELLIGDLNRIRLCKKFKKLYITEFFRLDKNGVFGI